MNPRQSIRDMPDEEEKSSDDEKMIELEDKLKKLILENKILKQQLLGKIINRSPTMINEPHTPTRKFTGLVPMPSGIGLSN